jgi:ribonuclease Y
MNNPVLLIIITLSAALIGGLIGFLIKKTLVENKRRAQNIKADHIIAEAREKAREIELEAKDNALQITQKAEEELARRRNELNKEDDRLQKRREELGIAPQQTPKQH